MGELWSSSSRAHFRSLVVLIPPHLPPIKSESKMSFTPPAGMDKACIPGDVDNGEKLFKARCTQCHTINKGGGNKQGPNLYGLIGRKSGAVPDYKYSPANKNAGVTWTNDSLYNYLENPKKYIPKTKMAFAGFKAPQDRADVTAYIVKASQE